MSFLKSNSANNYQQEIMGTYGCFKTSAGAVNFLESKAKVSNTPDGSNECRLTRYLRPVREALPVSEMNFNQLLQRDLDDHRVAVELVPYLLTPRNEGPAFFPPVVACLLPFKNRQPVETFPNKSEPKFIQDIGLWSSIEYGNAFRFDRLYEDEHKEHIAKLGRISWNTESAELVIIDGQHRAMALLAIDRTINKRWDGESAKYASFYEPVVKRCLEKYSDDEIKTIFESVELPVTVIWFPEPPIVGSHHKAARKVFVDLNKNARPPSPSRLMLLSDGDLMSVFTREILNEMRADGAGYPIYGVEYDNPARDQASSAKWSTLTNISCIFESVRRLCCGPDKHFTDMTSNFMGRDNETSMRITLRDALNIKNVLPETIVDERAYSRDDIDWSNFPSSKLELLTNQFSNGWGRILSKFYSNSLPFSSHSLALTQLKDGWMPNGVASSSLAKEAIFEGVGLYWTIRDSESHWREENQRRTEEGKSRLNGNDVVEAWGVTESKKLEFSKLRSKIFLGSDAKSTESDDAFQIFSTAACQIGYVLASRALSKKFSVEYSGVEKFSDVLIKALNAGLDNRRMFMSKTADRSINFLPRLDPSFSVYFRYFWLELFSSNEAIAVFKENGYSNSIDDLTTSAFNHYRSFVIKVNAKKYRDVDPDLSEDDSIAKATKELDKRFKKRLSTVFAVSAETYELRVANQSGIVQINTPEEAAQDGDVDPSLSTDSGTSSLEIEVQELDRLLREGE